jgi:hypothetical protein
MSMRIRKRHMFTLAATLTVVSPTPLAHADEFAHFQSPSGNISCVMAAFSGTAPEAACEIVDRTWTAPPRPQDCDAGWGDRIGLIQGSTAGLGCHSDTTRDIGLPTLAYGSSRSVASLTCRSAPTGITCTDSSTGHFFRISRESYELG